MVWQPTLYSLLAFGAAGISLAVATQIRAYREERGAVLFIGLLLAASGWAAAYGIQLGLSTAVGQRFFQRLGVAVGGSIPVLWLLFAFTYSGRDGWLTRRVLAVLAVEPVAFVMLTLTNPVHNLIWRDLDLAETAVGLALEPTFGVGMYTHVVVAYLNIVAGLGALFYVFLRNPTVYRTQTALLMLGAIVPLSANIAFFAGLSWGPFPALDPTPFTFVITGVLVGLAFFRFDLLTRAPVARQHVLNEMGDGLLVLDTDGQVVDANAVARRLLDADSPVGRPVTALFEDGNTGATVLDEIDGRTLTPTVDDTEQAYDVRCAELTDDSGEAIGHVVSFRNVTGRNRYEQRLEVTQRVLRHNLRNDISVIRSHAEQLARNGQHPEAEHIVDTTEQLMSLSEKSRLITRIDGRDGMGTVPVDAHERLHDLCEQFAAEYPGVTVDCDIPPDLTTPLPDTALFDIPAENVIENAIVHNDSSDPEVRVSARRVDSAVRVRIEDNGPEIPEMELEVLENGSESALQHGSSIGLWLSYWSVRTAGGTIEFETGDDGNAVIMEFPAVEQAAVA
jgi:signal transduction histidine kinase